MKKEPQMVSRRKFLFGVGTGLGSVGILDQVARSALGAGVHERPAAPIPFIHTTDLYNPPQDPDDHVDLATV